MEAGEIVDLVDEDQGGVQSENVVPDGDVEGSENVQLENMVPAEDDDAEPVTSCCKGCKNCLALTLRQLFDKGILRGTASKVSFAHDPKSSRFHLRLCRLCQGDFESYQDLHAHVEEKHAGMSTLDIIGGIEKNGDYLRCPFCPHYESLTQLLRHVIEGHSNGIDFGDALESYKKVFCNKPVQVWLWDKVIENCLSELHVFAEEMIEKNLQEKQNACETSKK